tara:strand:- start:8097 stop:8339 length:243 start_codon:yes stop_codon:yes gene_type:complete
MVPALIGVSDMSDICPPSCIICATTSDICICGIQVDEAGHCRETSCMLYVGNFCKTCGGNNEAAGKRDSPNAVVACECDI